MDQSLSPKNLRKIWDLESRRGRDRLALYPSVRRAYEKARDADQSARTMRRTGVPYIGVPESTPDELARQARSSADQLLEQALTITSEALIQSVEDETFAWGLTPGAVVGSARQTYTIADTAEAFFADKQLQRVVASNLPNHPRGRQSIVAGLIRTLDNSLPKVVVRADVEDFYGSIDHQQLRAHLNKSELSPSTRRLVNKLLLEFEALTGLAKGLPAGVGASAKLAELYIAQTDRNLRDSPGTLYFARYVDDIILVRGEETVGATSPASIVAEVEAEIKGISLSLNSTKTTYRAMVNNSLSRFDFLGYEIECRGSSGVSVKLTSGRTKAIRTRIDATFNAWDRADPDNHGRRSLLLDRLRLLTGNTRLSHNKRNALVGIYFSNPHVTDPSSLSGLDAYLQHRATQSALPTDLHQKVALLTFQSGFMRRTVHRWSMQRMKRLKGAWLA